MLITLAIAYGLLLICGCAWQRKLLYFPTKFSPAVAEQEASAAGFVPWRNTHGEIVGWKMSCASSPTGSVLIVHGNAGCALQRDYIARPIRDAAEVDVFVFEYPGYGARDGSPSMTSILTAAEEAFELLPQDRPIYLVSESLGAGVAAHLAKLHPTVAGMAMLVAYDNLASVAQSKIPWLLPYLILRDRFQPAAWLKDYRGPIKVVVAERDEVIPPKFGRRLFESYAGPKSLEVIAGANHNDVSEQSPEWWRDVFAFWASNR